jgi:hypothetical protein
MGQGRLKADAKPRAGGLGETLEGAGRGLDPPAFEPGDDRLGGAHRRGHLRLGHAGTAARLDQGRGERELVFQRLELGAKLGVLQPRLGGVTNGKRSLMSPLGSLDNHPHCQHPSPCGT